MPCEMKGFGSFSKERTQFLQACQDQIIPGPYISSHIPASSGMKMGISCLISVDLHVSHAPINDKSLRECSLHWEP